MRDRYQHAEDEYLKLRGEFDSGHITQAQFDERLRALMIQDEQGRYWMLGADSGKWYFYDGTRWVQSNPAGSAAPVTASAAPAAQPASPPAPTPGAYIPAPTPTPAPAAPGPTRRIPLLPILIGLTVLVLAVALFLIFRNRLPFGGGQASQIPTVLPPTITRAPSPTTIAELPTAGLPTLASETSAVPPTLAPETAAPDTAAPPVTVIVATTEPTETSLPPPSETTAADTPTVAAATRAPTAIPPTRVPTSVPATRPPAVNCPAGICVTNITLAPDAPKRGQNVSFTSTFVNSTGETRFFHYVVLLYDPNKAGGNKSFGESPALDISVPPGTSQATVSYISVKGPGGCITLFAQAANKNSPYSRDVFPNTDGQPFIRTFDVCP